MDRAHALDLDDYVEALVEASHRLIRATARVHAVRADVLAGVRYDETVLDTVLFAYQVAKVDENRARLVWEEWRPRGHVAPLPAAEPVDCTEWATPPPEALPRLRFARWLCQQGRLSEQIDVPSTGRTGGRTGRPTDCGPTA